MARTNQTKFTSSLRKCWALVLKRKALLKLKALEKVNEIVSHHDSKERL